MDTNDGRDSDDHEAILKLLYRTILGRDIESDALAARAANLARGVSFAEMFREVALSDEAQNHRSSVKALGEMGAVAQRLEHGDADRVLLINQAVSFAYEHFLRRTPSAEETAIWAGVIIEGMPVEKFLSEIARSEEASLKAGTVEFGAGLSDGEFLMAASEALFGRGLVPTEVVAWQRRLESGTLTRAELIRAMIEERLRISASGSTQAVHDADFCSIMGTSRMLSKRQWDQKADELCADRRGKPEIVPLQNRTFRHTGDYVVSMIASLYRGREFIEKFLENVVSQTLFNQSELIIIDANSPESEGEVIAAYQDVYPNIVYKRIGYRLGIYDAWNVGVEMARGRYLTNTNLDDLRRPDSIELQAAVLDAELEVDVVYQDFYYSFDPKLDFEDVKAFAFKSELPILTAGNLLQFNSPHNAPMWRKNLHSQVGLFDTRYKSAGDYEFWMRCLDAGKSFRKINIPHVVYYQNPKGISTRPETRGVEEAHEILLRYSPKLISKALLQSRRDFHAGLGIENRQRDDDLGRSYYDVVQDALIDLSGRRALECAVLPCDERKAAGRTEDRP